MGKSVIFVAVYRYKVISTVVDKRSPLKKPDVYRYKVISTVVDIVRNFNVEPVYRYKVISTVVDLASMNCRAVRAIDIK